MKTTNARFFRTVLLLALPVGLALSCSGNAKRDSGSGPAGSAGTAGAPTQSAGTAGAPTQSAGTGSAETGNGGTGNGGTDLGPMECGGNQAQDCEIKDGIGLRHCESGFWSTCQIERYCQEGAERPCADQLGACHGAVRSCIEGKWGPCSSVPAPDEVCDEKDNDCDGTIDNGCRCEEARDCEQQLGECLGSQQPCEAGKWLACSKHPSADICDGKDNDCDGETDEGCPCTSGAQQACGSDLGECTAGVQICEKSNWGRCDATEPDDKTERCDGKDNDCDGDTDEGCPCTAGAKQPCGQDLGECTAGTQTCANGNWGSCVGEKRPADKSERCDGLDNDCDGDTDEGCPCTDGATQPCGSDRGECTAGIQKCADGNWGACANAQGPTTETCDGKDNDCDGIRDNGFGEIGALCATSAHCPGRWTCSADGAASSCAVDEARFGDEVCDDLDNDCNGLVDLVSSAGTTVSACECERHLVIGSAVNASIESPLVCAAKCGGDFVPKRSIDGICWNVCESDTSDPDGDGWGGEQGLSCLRVGGAPWLRSVACPAQGFPVGMAITYCLDCRGTDRLPYVMCQSVPRFDLTEFARGQKQLRVKYTYAAAGPAKVPVNLWFETEGKQRKHLPLVKVGESPGYQVKTLGIQNACFTASEKFGPSCPGQGVACAHCQGSEVCGAAVECGAYDLTQAWLQIAAEFCEPQTGVHNGTVTVHDVSLVDLNCGG